MLDIIETGQCPVTTIPIAGDKRHIPSPEKNPSFTGKIPSFADYFNFFTTMSCILLFFVYIFV
jgi:hypothetical protein